MTQARRWIFWLLGIWLLGMAAAGCTSAAGEANGLAPAPFLGAWRACGGTAGAGGWLAGPYWFKGNLVGVATNMVFVWRADAPQGGARPLQVYPRSGSSAALRAGFVHAGGHNVLPEIAAWIRSHGGWRCSGEPAGEPYTAGSLTCQTFTNLALCYNPGAHRVTPQPVGQRFLQAKGRSLLAELPTARPSSAGWRAQVNASAQGSHWVALKARTVAPAGARCASLALQIDDWHASRVSHVAYKLTPCSALKQGVWHTTITLPKLSPGKHTVVVKLCAVGLNGWLACDEDSVTLTRPQTGR